VIEFDEKELVGCNGLAPKRSVGDVLRGVACASWWIAKTKELGDDALSVHDGGAIDARKTVDIKPREK
jgi:hypothetical protein